MKKLLSVVFYMEDGFFGSYKWVNLHLLVSKFICYFLMASIAIETQVQMIEYLSGDSTLLKVSSLIGLFTSLLVNGFFTKKVWILKVRKYYTILSFVATIGLVISNFIVVIDDNVVIRFIVNTIINNSIVTALSTSCSDTMNNLFEGSDKTIYQNKKQVISISASLVGMVLAFFIKLDLYSLIIFESLIYGVLCLNDLFIMRKLQKQVFGSSLDTEELNTEKEAA